MLQIGQALVELGDDAMRLLSKVNSVSREELCFLPFSFPSPLEDEGGRYRTMSVLKKC